MAGDAENGGGGLRVEATGLDVGEQLCRRLFGRVRRAVGTRFAHRLVGAGRTEDARRAGDRVARQSARVARAVQALLMLDGDCTERRQRFRSVQHALGQVRVCAHALPLTCPERAALVPDRIRHSEPSEVVHEARAPKRAHLFVRQPELCSGLRSQVGDCA